jgi:hypothetical protein
MRMCGASVMCRRNSLLWQHDEALYQATRDLDAVTISLSGQTYRWCTEQDTLACQRVRLRIG